MNQRITILVTDDDDAAAHLIQTNLKRTDLACTVMRAENGREAVDMLEGNLDEKTIPSNDRLLVLLDIRMPQMDGIQTLRYIKSSNELKRIPVIMLTTTDDPQEIANCYQLGCNFYMIKPVDYRKFVTTIKNLAEYIKICAFPEYSRATRILEKGSIK